MPDNIQLPSSTESIPNDIPDVKLTNITGLYVELANKVAEHTRVNTEELTKIIASMHQANQAY